MGKVQWLKGNKWTNCHRKIKSARKNVRRFKWCKKFNFGGSNIARTQISATHFVPNEFAKLSQAFNSDETNLIRGVDVAHWLPFSGKLYLHDIPPAPNIYCNGNDVAGSGLEIKYRRSRGASGVKWRNCHRKIKCAHKKVKTNEIRLRITENNNLHKANLVRHHNSHLIYGADIATWLQSFGTFDRPTIPPAPNIFNFEDTRFRTVPGSRTNRSNRITGDQILTYGPEHVNAGNAAGACIHVEEISNWLQSFADWSKRTNYELEEPRGDVFPDAIPFLHGSEARNETWHSRLVVTVLNCIIKTVNVRKVPESDYDGNVELTYTRSREEDFQTIAMLTQSLEIRDATIENLNIDMGNCDLTFNFIGCVIEICDFVRFRLPQTQIRGTIPPDISVILLFLNASVMVFTYVYIRQKTVNMKIHKKYVKYSLIRRNAQQINILSHTHNLFKKIV